MLGVKLFILQYLIFMVNAENRTSLKQLSARSEPANSLSHSGVMEIEAVPASERPRRTTFISSDLDAELKSIAKRNRLTVNPHQPQSRELMDGTHARPYRQVTPSVIDQLLQPESNLELQTEPVFIPLEETAEAVQPENDYNSDEPVTELKSELEPKPVPEADPELECKSSATPGKSAILYETLESPTLSQRSPFTEPTTETEVDQLTKPNLESGAESKYTSLETNLDVNCKEKNAYYAISDSCDTFVDCQKFIPTIKACPDGLLFNSKAKWPSYPCSYPSEVECGNNNYTDTSRVTPTGECPRRFGTFAASNNDCEKYIVCENGRPMLMSCPMGLGFNAKIGGCDWPANIPNCNPKIFKDFICPPKSIKSDKVYNYRYKRSCKLYITCIRGEPRLLRCDSGLLFDDESSRCISSAAISNSKCRTVSELVDTKLLLSKG